MTLNSSLLFLEAESVSSGGQEPGVVVWALHACVESEGLAGQLAGVERARVGQGTESLALDITLLLPLGVVAEGVDVHRVLHPLDHLKNVQ